MLDWRNWTIFGWIRLALAFLVGTVILFIFGILAESNVRHLFEDRGWDTFLTRAFTAMPEILQYPAAWLGIGLLFGAAAAIWLIWAFPHRLGEDDTLQKSPSVKRITASIAVVLVVGAFYLATVQAKPPPLKDDWVYPTSLSPGFTQQQVDDLVAGATKQLKAQIDQANNDAQSLRQNTAKQIADAVAKATAQSSAQSDAPVGVDKLPTSLKVLLKGPDYEEIDLRNVISTTKLIMWRQRPNLLTTQNYPGLAILIVFKKPLVYGDVHIDDHGTGISTFELTSQNPRYAILTFDSIYYNGLLDITFTK
jgi:hypothetical protein